MSKPLGIILTLIVLIVAARVLLSRLFFKTHLDEAPEIATLPTARFEFSSAKPYYFLADKKLFYASDGKLDYSRNPIWTGKIDYAYISPDNKHALLYTEKELILIDNTGTERFRIRDCTDVIGVENYRQSGRFISSEVQWSENSEFFLIAQDRVWVHDFSGENKSSIYRYTLANQSFRPFAELDEALKGDFLLSRGGQYLYYEFANAKGDLGFKKLDLAKNAMLSEHFGDNSLKLPGMSADSVFLNYTEFKTSFQGNSYDLRAIVVPVQGLDAGLYYRDRDTTVRLLGGTSGYSAFKGFSFHYFKDGFFLPGNRYFVANVDASNFTGQLVIDTRTFEVMTLERETAFFFNVNSNDCPDFVFRYEIEPNVRFATSMSLEIARQNVGAPARTW